MYPAKRGISSSPAYARVMRQGQPFEEKDFEGRLALDCPEVLELPFRAISRGHCRCCRLLTERIFYA
ncbi:MAG: hypothetical protein Ct9H300mP16_13860 [Pseudomonadota bacterium]|nr:MAG: hypothetical protein Ct9H300mP16_13860 [Pseudomonadota bacterium]